MAAGGLSTRHRRVLWAGSPFRAPGRGGHQAASWHPDPQVPGQQRYWDGSRWTEHTAPAGPWAGQPFRSPGTGGQPGGNLATQGQRNWFVRHKILTGLLAFVLILGIAGAASGGEP